MIDSVEAQPDLAQVEAYLFREAELLDERHYGDWLDLFTDDAIYWIPSGGDAAADPASQVSIVYDDFKRLQERIWRLGSGLAHAQEPVSRTAHLIGNVRLAEATRDLFTVSSTFAVVEVRRGRQNVYAGHLRHVLAIDRTPWRIKLKRVDLLSSDLPLGNLSFLL